ncbi:hypothetical protein [Xanthomonas phage RTH11]|nr:hypothetical protein [Xanthomonas phage RTH11]
MKREERYPVEVNGEVIQVPAHFMHEKITASNLEHIRIYWHVTTRERYHKKRK